jgi:hypothetical protein
MSVSVEDCRRVFDVSADFASDSYAPIDRLYSALAETTDAERLDLVKQLLSELETFYSFWYDKSSWKYSPSARIYSTLLRSLEFAKDVSREDYLYIFDNAHAYIVDSLVANPEFPVGLLIDDSIFTRHSGDPYLDDFKYTVEAVISHRFKEVIAYCRGIVPNSEHMTNEMVLNVAGVDFGGYSQLEPAIQI